MDPLKIIAYHFTRTESRIQISLLKLNFCLYNFYILLIFHKILMFFFLFIIENILSTKALKSAIYCRRYKFSV